MHLYSRRVSFNNLYPVYIDPTRPLHKPPQLDDDNDDESKRPRFFDLNFGFGNAAINNIEEHYHDASHRPNSNNSKRKRAPKLPPPPSKSILKKKKYNDEINYTITGVYKESPEDDNAAVYSSDSEEDEKKPALPILPPQLLPETKPRRKSFADMTNEELEALENSYNKRSSLNIESFNFKDMPSVYIKPPLEPKGQQQSLASSVSLAASSSIQPAIDKLYPSRPVIDHGACCVSSKHKDYDRLFQDESKCRVLFSIITGRKHTWNSIDYVINDLLHDGDHIVITSHISVKETEHIDLRQKVARTVAKDPGADDDPEFVTSKQYNISPRVIYQKCQNILGYALQLIELRHLNVRISIEIINCNSSKQVFHDGMKLYKPHLVVVGSKTDELAGLQRVFSTMSSISSSSALEKNLEQLQNPPVNHVQRRKSSSGTISTLGRGYNGYYRVAGNKCMKLTSYIIDRSPVPVIVVTDNYMLRSSTKFGNFQITVTDTEKESSAALETQADPMKQFQNKLTQITDQSRLTTIQELELKQERRSSDNSSTGSPQPFVGQKVKFGDDLDFGNGHAMYKVKSLLDPVSNSTTAASRSSTRSSGSGTIVNHPKKKNQRSKSDSHVVNDGNSNGGGLGKLAISFKKFGFGK